MMTQSTPMKLTTLDLTPTQDEQGRNEDARALYLNRVSGTQGTTPDEVLVEWFQAHPAAAASWKFLDLAAFDWEMMSFAKDALPGAEVFRRGPSQLRGLMNEVHFMSLWVWQRVQKDGTWHTPPILFKTPGLEGAPPDFKSPLHLAEGHHRLAAVHRAIADNIKVADEHVFWVATLREGQTGVVPPASTSSPD